MNEFVPETHKLMCETEKLKFVNEVYKGKINAFEPNVSGQVARNAKFWHPNFIRVLHRETEVNKECVYNISRSLHHLETKQIARRKGFSELTVTCLTMGC